MRLLAIHLQDHISHAPTGIECLLHHNAAHFPLVVYQIDACSQTTTILAGLQGSAAHGFAASLPVSLLTCALGHGLSGKEIDGNYAFPHPKPLPFAQSLIVPTGSASNKSVTLLAASSHQDTPKRDFGRFSMTMIASKIKEHETSSVLFSFLQKS